MSNSLKGRLHFEFTAFSFGLIFIFFPMSFAYAKSFFVADNTSQTRISNVRCIKDPNQQDSGVYVSKRRFSPGVWALEFSHYPADVSDKNRLHGEILGPQSVIGMIREFCEYGFKIRRADKTSAGKFIMAPSARLKRDKTPFDETDLFQFCANGCTFSLVEEGVVVDGGDPSVLTGNPNDSSRQPELEEPILLENEKQPDIAVINSDEPELSSQLLVEDNESKNPVDITEIDTIPISEVETSSSLEDSNNNASKELQQNAPSLGLTESTDKSSSLANSDENRNRSWPILESLTRYVSENGVQHVGIIFALIFVSILLVVFILIWDFNARKRTPPPLFRMSNGKVDSGNKSLRRRSAKDEYDIDKTYSVENISSKSKSKHSSSDTKILSKDKRLLELEMMIEKQNKQLEESQQMYKNLSNQMRNKEIEQTSIDSMNYKEKLKQLDNETKGIVENQWPRKKRIPPNKKR